MKHWLLAGLAALAGGALLCFMKGEDVQDETVPVRGAKYEHLLNRFNREIAPRIMKMHCEYVEILRNAPNFIGLPAVLNYRIGLGVVSVDTATHEIITPSENALKAMGLESTLVPN